MKKSLLKNVRQILSLTFFLLTISFIIYSCRKEAKETGTLHQPLQSLINVDIAALKEIYNKAIGSNGVGALSGSSTLNLIRTLNVNWDTYTLQKRKDSSIVAEFDMKNDTGLFLLKKLYPGDTIKYVNKTTVTFIKFKDGSRLNFFTKIIEDLTSPGSHSVMDKLHYNQVPYGFNGMILYYTLDRQYINGYRYVNGGIQGTISLTAEAPPETSPLSVNNIKKNDYMSCVSYPIWRMDCEWGGNATNPYQDFHGCTDSIVGSGLDCYTTGGGGGGVSGDLGGGTGGGGGGGSPSTNPCAIHAVMPPVAIESVNNGKHIMSAQPDPGDGSGGSGGGGGTGSSGPCATNNNQIIRVDSLAKHFPCAAALIINNLSGCGVYSDLVQVFTTNQKPDLIWQDATLDWNILDPNGSSSIYKLGQTSPETGGLQLGATITLNTKMLQNSSKLLIASTAVHETLHAFINYNVSMATEDKKQGYITDGSWLYSIDSWINIYGLPSNYSNHYEMLSSYFDKAVNSLAQLDNYSHTTKEYKMAMLYGLDNASDGSSSQKALLQTEFNSILTKNNITSADLNQFYKANLNAISANKLPTTGCGN